MMKNAIINGFLSAMREPQFQELLDQFSALRGKVVVRTPASLIQALQFLLLTVQNVLRDRIMSLTMTGEDDGLCHR